jgi:outer membrane protein OmpA-like peptidoglycan-associated protein
VGSEAYNQTLSERRAQAVRDYLASRNVDPSALTTVGVGEADPLDRANGADPINRRVAVINLGAS